MFELLKTCIFITIIDNTKLNSTNRDCDLIFSGSITLTGYMIWDLLIGITWKTKNLIWSIL